MPASLQTAASRVYLFKVTAVGGAGPFLLQSSRAPSRLSGDTAGPPLRGGPARVWKVRGWGGAGRAPPPGPPLAEAALLPAGAAPQRRGSRRSGRPASAAAAPHSRHAEPGHGPADAVPGAGALPGAPGPRRLLRLGHGLVADPGLQRRLRLLLPEQHCQGEPGAGAAERGWLRGPEGARRH